MNDYLERKTIPICVVALHKGSVITRTQRFDWKLLKQLFSLAFLILCFSNASAKPTNHALIIAISEYQSQISGFSRLLGPKYDYQAIVDIVRNKWQFENVFALLDDKATRSGILKAFDNISEQAKPGDNIFIYYSGHGTGDEDASFSVSDLSAGTGAWIPWDFQLFDANEQILDTTRIAEQLIVGRWDIKPRLIKLDKKGVNTWVVVDSCYSGNITRSASIANITPRYADLRAAAQQTIPQGPGDCKHCRDDIENKHYQFRNTVVFTAAGSNEVAADIPNGQGLTIDDQPHGLFTNAFLSALDKNQRDNPNYEDLFSDIERLSKTTSVNNNQQNPVLLPEPFEVGSEKVLLQSVPFLRSTITPIDPLGDSDANLKVSVDPSLSSTLALVKSLKGIIVTDAIGKIQFRKYKCNNNNSDTLAAFDNSGNLVHCFSQKDEANPNLIERWILSRVWLHKRDLHDSVRGNDFRLILKRNNGTSGHYAKIGSNLFFTILTGRAAQLLVLDMQSDGTIAILYPYTKMELNAITANDTITIPSEDGVIVQDPIGTDSVMLYAFSSSSDGNLLAEFWLQRQNLLTIDNPLIKQLEKRLENPEGIASARLDFFVEPN